MKFEDSGSPIGINSNKSNNNKVSGARITQDRIMSMFGSDGRILVEEIDQATVEEQDTELGRWVLRDHLYFLKFFIKNLSRLTIASCFDRFVRHIREIRAFPAF